MRGKSIRPHFGPAGNSDSYTETGHKTILQAPAFVAGMGLDAYEYQGGHGINISDEKAAQLGEKAKEHDVRLSIHTPYYISLSSVEKEKRDGSIGYILRSAKAARAMGAGRLVVHSGSCSKMARSEALELAKDTLSRALDAMDEEGYSDIHLCPETMGKINQLGTVDEVMELCSLDERLIPCIDFGHVNARTNGSLKELRDYETIFDAIENKLGTERLKVFHSHFSKIQYTENGGEKVHLTFEDTVYGPEFEPVAELCYKKGCTPTFICESSGTQAEDAVIMKGIYDGFAVAE